MKANYLNSSAAQSDRRTIRATNLSTSQGSAWSLAVVGVRLLSSLFLLSPLAFDMTAAGASMVAALLMVSAMTKIPRAGLVVPLASAIVSLLLGTAILLCSAGIWRVVDDFYQGSMHGQRAWIADSQLFPTLSMHWHCSNAVPRLTRPVTWVLLVLDSLTLLIAAIAGRSSQRGVTIMPSLMPMAPSPRTHAPPSSLDSVLGGASLRFSPGKSKETAPQPQLGLKNGPQAPVAGSRLEFTSGSKSHSGMGPGSTPDAAPASSLFAAPNFVAPVRNDVAQRLEVSADPTVSLLGGLSLGEQGLGSGSGFTSSGASSPRGLGALMKLFAPPASPQNGGGGSGGGGIGIGGGGIGIGGIGGSFSGGVSGVGGGYASSPRRVNALFVVPEPRLSAKLGRALSRWVQELRAQAIALAPVASAILRGARHVVTHRGFHLALCVAVAAWLVLAVIFPAARWVIDRITLGEGVVIALLALAVKKGVATTAAVVVE